MSKHDSDRVLAELERLAALMDDCFRVPGTSLRFGLDPLLGLIPGAGDTASAAVAGYMIFRARQLKVPASLLLAMTGNLLADWLIGLVPELGDLFDFGFKAHRRNARLLRRHLDGQGNRARQRR